MLITMGVHRCSICSRYFRAQPPFSVQKRRVYAERVREKAVLPVYGDGRPFRRGAGRLARDLLVSPSEAMICRWRREFAGGGLRE
jgi:hypothetical protein